MGITKAPDKINKSVQEMNNLSFDTEFNILAREMLVYNPVADTMDRMTQISAGVVSTNNSTTDLLDSDGVFTGTADDVVNYKSIGINIIASHTSATNGLTFQFSSDGTNWDKIHSFTIPANTAKFFNMPVESRYFRVVYTNGETLQTSFRLQVIYHATMTKESTLRLKEAIDAETAAQLGRSVISGLDFASGLFKNINAYDTGSVVALLNIPVSSYAVKVTVDGDVTYVGKAGAGTAEATAGWQAMKIDETSGVKVTWADGNSKFDNVATDLTALDYS